MLTISGQLHFGYLQMSAGAPGGGDLYPMQVDVVAWETTPGLAITTSLLPIPEPSSALLIGGGLAMLALRRESTREPLSD